MRRTIIIWAVLPTALYAALPRVLAQLPTPPDGWGEQGVLLTVLFAALTSLAWIGRTYHKDARARETDLIQRLRALEERQAAQATEAAQALRDNAAALHDVAIALRGCPHHEPDAEHADTPAAARARRRLAELPR